MTEHVTKLRDLAANNDIFIVTRHNLDDLLVVKAGGETIFEASLPDIVDEAQRHGYVVKSDEMQAIRDHMWDQPTSLTCSLCGGHVNHEASVSRAGDLSISVNPCDCIEKMARKMSAQRGYCLTNKYPFFASRNTCSKCGLPWTICGPREKFTLEQAGSAHITSCPHCHTSWCD